LKFIIVCAVYLSFAMIKGITSLDSDEFAFIGEPYEMLGGDYTSAYLNEGEYQKALNTVAKSYYFFWQYRAMFAPIVDEKHKTMFAEEEKKHGYIKPESVMRGDPESLQKFKSRLIVPEPDRFYWQGAGKPLLPAVLSIPQLFLVSNFYSGREILEIQFNTRLHPVFILVRLVQIISGLISIILIYNIIKKEKNPETGLLGASIFAFFPLTMHYFPDLHHDSILIPFFIASGYLLLKDKYIKGGLIFGLALASKNTAIFLLPAFSLFYIWNANNIKVSKGLSEAFQYLVVKAKHIAVFLLLSVVTLAPFANPVSYINEILTPITHREFDNRGADVSRFMLMHDEDTALDKDNEVSSIIVLVRSFLQIRSIGGFRTGFLFFAILCVLLCVQARPNKISMYSLSFMLMMLPYGLVFKYHMANRYLIFVPYFAILCTGMLSHKYLKVLMWMLLGLSLLFCVELLTGHPEWWVS